MPVSVWAGEAVIKTVILFLLFMLALALIAGPGPRAFALKLLRKLGLVR